MKLTHLALTLSLLTPAAFAQSKEDRRASLTGITGLGIQETGVAALGGGSAGSPYLLQAEKAFKGAGLAVVDLEKANSNGWPIYNVHCSAMDAGADLRVACEGRLLRFVYLEQAEKAKGVYAIVWTSPLMVAAVPRDAVSDVEKLTQMLADAFVKDFKEANPGAAAPAKGGAKKK